MGRCARLLICYLCLLPALTAATSVYQQVIAELGDLPHRQPGSEQHLRSVETLEAILQNAGLETHRQLYETVVPVDTTCELRVGDRRLGAEPYLVVAAGSLPSTLGEVIEGPAVYCGTGTGAELDGKQLEGAIAVLELGAPGIRDVMRLGARAVVLVDNEHASQWDVSRHRPIEGAPTVWIRREEARAAGLLSDEPVEASLELAMAWEDRETINLWAEIPGDGTTFSLGSPEIMTLSATLDTIGMVPTYCPQDRGLANVALLTQTLVELADSEPKRHIVGLFLGSHMAAEEGMRHFLFPYNYARDNTRETLAERADLYRRLMAEAERFRGFLGRENFLNDESHPDYADMTKRLRQKIDDRTSDINYRLSQVYRRIKSLETEKQNLERGKIAALREGWQQRYDDLTAERDSLGSLKSRWNDMNRQVLERDIREEDRDIFRDLLQGVRADLERQRSDMAKRLRYNATFQSLADLMGPRQIVGIFHFDFADPERQWLFNMTGFRDVHTPGEFNIGSFKKQVDEMRKVYEQVAQEEWQGSNLNREAGELRRNPASLCYPGLRSLACVPAHAVAVYGYNLCNLAAPLDDDEMPRRIAVDLEPLAAQMSTFFERLVDARELSVSYRNQRSQFADPLTFSEGTFGKPAGMLVQSYVKGGSDLAGPMPGALLACGNLNVSRNQTIAGHLRSSLTSANALGLVFEPNIHTSGASRQSQAFMLDEFGRAVYRSVSPHLTRIIMRYGNGGAFTTPFFPNEYDSIDSAEFLLAATDATFNPETDSGKMSLAGGQVHMTREDTRWKLSAKHGLLMLGSQYETRDIRDDEPTLYHNGLSNDTDELLNLDTIAQSSNDLGMLNEHRLDILRRKNIISDAAETLNATADEYREQAQQLRGQGRWSQAEAKEIFALCHDFRAYSPTRKVSDDMVFAVIILMLLCIPFAFSMERLCVGATSIYRQLLGFGVIFLTTFLILYMLHPAFSLAAAPVVIFLAFVIIMMSGMVIYVVMSRFKQELLALQGLASKTHNEEGTTGTALASIFIGISGMRNRPLKTFLTAATVVLLTFTILVFASFNSSVGVVESYMGQGSGVDRIEVHRSSYLPIPEKLAAALHFEYNEEFHIFERGGYFKDPTSEETRDLNLAVYCPRNGAFASLSAVVGLNPQESRLNPELSNIVGSWRDGVEEDLDRPIWIPPSVAEAMDLREGDTVTLRGVAFIYQGSFNVGGMQAQAYISGGRYVPPDYEAIFRQMELSASGSGAAGELEKVDTSSFQWMAASELAIVDVADLAVFGRTRDLINTLVFYPKGDNDTYQAANRISTIFNDPIFTKGPEGAKSYFFTEAFKGSGFGEVIVPLLLGGLIIFSSLLGSIVDREREIFTFSALGLSPPNVAALFFAESSVYAVIGGVGGYLVSQIVAAFLKFLASYGLFQPPEMNFSSLSSTYTILVVMATVILSTIYPAIKAGKSANPGVARKWKMPTPEGNKLNFLFPFTVSTSDMAGILSFIHEHFDNHRDASLGSFAAMSVQVKRLPDDDQLGQDNYAIDAEVSLAPFDLGIFQRFRMSSRDSDIEGIKEVLVELELHSGSPAAWLRSNRAFIADLRKQFLLWRSLPPETVEHYCSQTTHEALMTQSIPVREAPRVGLEGGEQVSTQSNPAVDDDQQA